MSQTAMHSQSSHALFDFQVVGSSELEIIRHIIVKNPRSLALLPNFLQRGHSIYTNSGLGYRDHAGIDGVGTIGGIGEL